MNPILSDLPTEELVKELTRRFEDFAYVGWVGEGKTKDGQFRAGFRGAHLRVVGMLSALQAKVLDDFSAIHERSPQDPDPPHLPNAPPTWS